MSVVIRSVLGIVAWLWIGLAGSTRADQVVWQIGTFDNDFAELGKTRDFRQYMMYYADDVVFVVGKSDAGKDWPFIHPGPRDRFAGRKAHAYTIEFELGRAPIAPLVLRIDLVDAHHRWPPQLKVRVNGAEGRFALKAGAGDASLKDPSKGREQVLDVRIAPRLLRQGPNRIVIVNDSGSHVQYDALALLETSQATPQQGRLVVQATRLFVRTKDGPRRLARIRIEGPAAQEDGRLRVTVGDRHADQTVKPVPLGDHAVEVRLPPIEDGKTGTIELKTKAETLTAAVSVPQARRWKIYVAPMVHTDIGYTDHQSKIPEIHCANIDRAIELCGKYPDYRYRLEGSWAARMYERHRSPEQFKQLIALVRQRRIGIEGTFVNMLTGLCSAEELVRLLYPSAELARRYGIAFETATQNDTPSYVWSFPTILHSAGIRYLSVGVNNNGTRGPILRGGLDKRSPFWWQGPDGGKVLTWYARGYVDAERAGLREGLAAAERKLPVWLESWEQRSDYPYDAVLIHGAYGDNREIGEALAETITAWNAKYAYPKIVMTGFDEFFEYVEKNYADKIPTVRGCGGGYWEDGAASSARETGINRRNHHRIVAAEAVHAALAVLDPSHTYPQSVLAKAWENILLYDEHTWGARRWGLDPEHESVKRQWVTKSAFATDAERDSIGLLSRGLGDLARCVKAKGPRIVVYNPLSWERTEVVTSTLPPGTALFDPSGREVAMQSLGVRERREPVCFLAEDVPATGYRCYELRDTGRKAEPAPHTPPPATVLENDFYRVALCSRSGGISSIVDKQTGRELVDAESPYKLGELIYATGGKDTTAIAWSKGLPKVKLDLHRPKQATWRLIRDGKLLTTAVSETKTTMFPKVSVEVTLYRHVKRIDVALQLDKELTYEMESAYVAFPFAMKRPDVAVEVGGGWVRVPQDMLPGACLDWFSVQQGVTLNGDGLGVNFCPVDTPLIQFCDINTGKWLQKLGVTNGTIFAYIMNNYWLTNYLPGQGGHFRFRYSLTSDTSMSRLAATRHGWGVAQPMKAVTRTVSAGKGTIPASGSFVQISAPNVVLTAFKQAEDVQGLVLRLLEVAGKDTTFEVGPGVLGAAKAAWRCDAVERKGDALPIKNGTLPLSISACGVETIRVAY